MVSDRRCGTLQYLTKTGTRSIGETTPVINLQYIDAEDVLGAE